MKNNARSSSFFRSSLLRLAAFGLAGLLTACGGGGGGGSGEVPPPLLSLTFPGQAVAKVRTGTQGPVVLVERLQGVNDADPVLRKLLLLRAGAQTGEYVPPQGWSLLDFAVHPSGEMSAILGTDMALRLVRLSATGAVLHDQPLLDPDARTDPQIEQSGTINPDSMVPAYSRDAARVAPIGEDLAVAVRTGINAVVAYRFDRTGAGFVKAWRRLVEPGMTLLGRFLSSGSYDVFAQLANHVKVVLDTDGQGRLAVGVAGGLASDLFAAHGQYFNEPTLDVTYGALVTQISPAGERLNSTVLNTSKASELHGLRAVGNGFALVGRVRTERREDGWDAYAALITPAGALQYYRVIDVDRGDVLLDIVPGRNSQLLAAGASGYTQNPLGASISEETTPLLLALSESGGVVSRLSVAAGARQNQLRSLATYGANWLVGGLVNGPGTHSGDADPTLIRADGVLREIAPTAP